MKQKLILAVMILVISSAAIAQEGNNRGRGQWGGQRKTVAERVKMIHDKFDSTFKFEVKKQAAIDSAFAEQYREQDKMREEMMAKFSDGTQPDQAARDEMRDKAKEVTILRDEKLQTLMTEAEYKKWKNELEPSLRPQRGQGAGGQGRQGGN